MHISPSPAQETDFLFLDRQQDVATPRLYDIVAMNMIDGAAMVCRLYSSGWQKICL